MKINHESSFRRGVGGWNFPNKIQKYGNFEINLERVRQQLKVYCATNTLTCLTLEIPARFRYSNSSTAYSNSSIATPKTGRNGCRFREIPLTHKPKPGHFGWSGGLTLEIPIFGSLFRDPGRSFETQKNFCEKKVF